MLIVPLYVEFNCDVIFTSEYPFRLLATLAKGRDTFNWPSAGTIKRTSESQWGMWVHPRILCLLYLSPTPTFSSYLCLALTISLTTRVRVRASEIHTVVLPEKRIPCSRLEGERETQTSQSIKKMGFCFNSHSSHSEGKVE